MTSLIHQEKMVMDSHFLNRKVELDLCLPRDRAAERPLPLLVLNDGQDHRSVGVVATLHNETRARRIRPLCAVGVVAGDRMAEYGTAHRADYQNRGHLAEAYSRFVAEELVPHLQSRYDLSRDPRSAAIAGYSLGGLSAMDIAWNHPHLFGKAGMFSASFWWRRFTWRERILGADYGRLMIRQIMRTRRPPELKCWFQAGTLDEADDRNQNGIIDAIDDTLDVMAALTRRGYRPYYDYVYHEVARGRHHPDTWKEAMPYFLRWAFGTDE